MTERRVQVSVDADGVRTSEDLRVRLLGRLFVAACVLVIAGAAVAFWMLRREPREATTDASTSRSAASTPVASSETVTATSQPRRVLRAVHRTRVAPAPGAQPAPGSPPGPGAGRAEAAGGTQQEAEEPELDARDVIEALRAAGETEGIAAFPPPGTDPPKPGIIVPDDYEVPEGYVRHHQSTDDGRALDPILMFSPDYEFVDDAGQPIPLPPDGVVPPEMAPPGLPIRILEVPKRKRGS